MKLTKAFFNDIRELIQAARATVARGVDLSRFTPTSKLGDGSSNRSRRGRIGPHMAKKS